ncbi:MAG: response regulator [Acidimicrobiia bacterium]|nr:response regulator [Acidimicrobiia bacterium]
MISHDWVLLLDDDPWALEITETVLTSHGITVHATRTEEEAVEAIDRLGPPAVLLLDVMMPGADGFAVCRRLRAQGALRHTRVVFVTALDDESSRVAALEAGADDLITKPFSEAILVTRIRSLVELARLRDRDQARLEYEMVLDSIEEGALTVDDNDVVITANRPARRLLGMSNSSLEGISLPAFIAEHWAVERGRVGRASSARLVSRGPGSAAALDWTSRELPGGEGTHAAWTVVVRDATDAHDQDRALSRLIRTLSHKLRTPLAGVGTSLELVAESSNLDDDCQVLIDVARSSAQRLTDTLLRILDFTSALTAESRSQLEILSPDRVREQLALEPSVDVVTVPAGHVSVELDLVRRCLDELMGNARDADATRLSLNIWSNPDATMTFALNDDGFGLPPGSTERIFEPFYQVDRTGEAEGAGLGLAMVAAEVEARGGTVGASSPVEGPTTVWFRLPIVNSDAGHPVTT